MATWKSADAIKWEYDAGSTSALAETSWEYQTTSDALSIITTTAKYSGWGETSDAPENVNVYSREEALALLETLIDWAETYEGEDTVLKLIETRKERV